MMGRLLLPLLEMMRLRSGPQDLPASRQLTILLAILYMAQGFIADRILDESTAAPRTVVAIAVQFAAIAALLGFKQFISRLDQTICALAGTGFIFGFISLWLLSLVDPANPRAELALAYLALFLWSIAVDGNIYRHALSIKMAQGVLVAVLIFFINYTLLRAVFG